MRPLPPFDAETWLLLVNPVSGGASGLARRSRIEAALAGRGLKSRTAVSEYAGHSIAIVRAAVAAGCRRVLVAGGDGSASEAVNGIFGQGAANAGEIRLALLPIGTGNDWARSLGLAQTIDGVADAMAGGDLRSVDVGCIDFADGSARRHFINVAGLGFDAEVIARMPSRRFGRLAYLAGLLRALTALRPLPLRLAVEGGPAEAQAFVVFVCLGRYCGGGMLVAPQARCDGGRLAFTLIRHMGRWQVLRSLPRLFDGSILAHPLVRGWTAGGGRIDAPAGTLVEADGELVGTAPALFSVLPRALAVVVPGPS